MELSPSPDPTSNPNQEMELSAQELHSRAKAEHAAAEQAAAAVQAARAQESAIYALPVHKQLSLAQTRNATWWERQHQVGEAGTNGSAVLLDANSSAATRKEKRRMQSMLMLFAFRRG